MDSLAGKVGIVTGSSRGIGEAIARRLALAGTKVVVSARSVEVRDERLPGTVHSVAKAIQDAGGDAIGIAANLQKREERIALVENTIRHFGRVDILINNAAILVPGGTVEFSERYFDRMVEILVKAPFHLSQLVLPGMIERQEGSIMNISSKAAVHPQPGRVVMDGAVYGMAKAAIERFTTGLSAEMFENNIAVTALAPESFVATPGQMFGRKYTREMLDRAEPVEMMSEAAYALLTSPVKTVTGGIRFTQEVLKEYKAELVDVGMPVPQPN